MGSTGNAICTCPHRATPIFACAQVGDVVLLDAARETGARNERRLVAVVCAKEGTFEIIHGLLNRVMEVLGVPLTGGG